ncbi:hypothetical protein DL766_002458 [Monosporascus sp. MC13-8B]|nr:hypothetical protein DL763_003676 [Monosporascus cannonballus]RYP35447.1 hypothetical protein DL766_002458 [Monosporascus sp. MC13-8B]
MPRIPFLIPDILSSPSSEDGDRGEGDDRHYVARARGNRRPELAALDLRGIHAPDVAFVLGLSWRVRGCTSDVDLVGGLDIRRVTCHSTLLPTVQQPNNSSDREQQPPHRQRHRDFAAILAQIDTAAFAALALQTLKQRRGPSYYAPLPHVGEPVFGSAHVLCPVSFDDRRRTRWIVKVPLTGTPDVWDELGADSLRGEELVLRMLGALGRRGGGSRGRGAEKGEGRFPAPQPIRVDPGVHNALHAPYFIMEFVEGVQLDEYWFAGTDTIVGDQAYSVEHIKLRRLRVLHSLARAMLRLRYGNGGSPRHQRGHLARTPRRRGTRAPPRRLSHGLPVVRPLRRPRYGGRAHTGLRGRLTARRPVRSLHGPAGSAPARDGGRAGRGRAPAAADRDAAGARATRGAAEGEGKGAGTAPFAIAHPDLQLRHVIVSEDGDLKAIVGWDGVRAVPRSVCNEALPRWLVRDFNPFVYGWRPTAAAAGLVAASDAPGEAGRSGSCPDDPPWVLAELRDASRRRRGDYRRDVDATRQSLLALLLDEAANDPKSRSAVLRRVLEKCSTRFEEPLDYDYFVDVLGRGERLDRRKVECLRRNFRELAETGSVRDRSPLP